ncbi:hypothetical protein [Paraburkholderia tagetis]|uniref:Glycine-rich domain-containing protein n=1 Tax=Paraburkholderia tagetis TaxID=2913261 RepID=A0A9X1UG99_9BURK|nr:hypothetical protein [Paraburkholderia tagetis]MCG5072292.1 hypothetical protein [Paraburkholderia tagetis]
MDRATVYTQEQGRSVDFLFAQRATMIGLAKLSQAAFGSGTVVRGLAVTPNSPAALNVLVGIGEIYTMAAVDATSWGALPADTTDIILKQGLNMAAQTISTPAPSTSGYSINYLIEAQYQDQDNVPVVLPFYNSNNPQIPLNGQGGGGATLPTERQGVCVIQAKAGIAATTGTQTTPSVDAGWTALAVVTVANGQTTVTSGNISVPAGVPQLTSLLQMMQTGSTEYAVDTSTTANVISIALTPAITSYSDAQPVTFKAANNNTGPCTLNFGGGAVNLVGAAGALQGGEIVAGNMYTGLYSASLNEVVLNSQTAGALQVNPATKGQHAAQLSQVGFQNIAVYEIIGGVQKVSVNGAAFTTTGATTFTVPVSGRFKARVWGGGGGGGSGVTSAAATGGAGGGYTEGVFSVAGGTSEAITVGAGGANGTGSGNGSAGGSSSVGALATATGGGGGVGSASGTSSGSSVAGGTGSGGSLNITGQGPASAYAIGSSLIASGGGGAFGTPPSAISVGSATGATFPGGAGGGGANNNIGAPGAGGCVIIEY